VTDDPPGAPPEPPGPAPSAAAAPHAGSLCLDCQFHRLVASKTSTFVMCSALPVKYPRQPVRVCPLHRRAAGP
jgi:hypothetical protein